jgi:uncharacterized integral membrane protein (TIGR00697 family)
MDPLDPRPAGGARRHLEILAGLFTGLLIISNVCSNRLVVLGPLEFDAGTLMFPLTYVLGDLLTEVYGLAASRRVIWTGFGALVLLAAGLWAASALPAPDGWDGAAAFDSALALTPRLVLGSLAAYLVGELTNATILARMKAARPRSGPAFRLMASTVGGQSLDTVIFAVIAFWGVLDLRLWVGLVVSNYVFKVGLEALLLPLTLKIVRLLKAAAGSDAAPAAGRDVGPVF